MASIKIDGGKVKSVSEVLSGIRRQLGEPIVKVELTDQQILDNINQALDGFVIGASVSYEEQYYALALEGGKNEYTLSDGILDIIDFSEYSTYSAGINTLFTIPNQMNMAGLFDFSMQGAHTMLLLNYHLVLDFIETLQRYSSSKYQGSFDTYDKVLYLTPAPEHEKRVIVDDANGTSIAVDSPGGVLLHVKQFVGAGRPGGTLNKALSKLLGEIGVRRYALALCKILLGHIRGKYANFASIGNTGIALDGSDLISEGITERDELEKQLMEEGRYDMTGYGIITGVLS